MDHVYPQGPAAVPPNLTAATSTYKQRAWLAMLGLAVFIALYFALSGWFAWTSWRLFASIFGAGGHFHIGSFAVAICSAFLAVFMLKALFFIQHRYAIDDIEVTREEQPLLFDFIDRLADEARAPRAHKVYLSARVNAAVFYDLSLLNLIIPSKKNLEIGLGLINVLSLGELKAVLAHEFGHFAQRSMAVGRWVYISQQIAGHIVARRDALDRLLQQLSRWDLRIAWVGWVLSIIVWSIRSLMDVLFRGVLLAQRALSRQMEFQADLVAVSLTGSDALVHALHKLQAADDAWDKALSFAGTEANNKRAVSDLFVVQDRIIERMREILSQPMYGRVPPIPESARERHRVFKEELAQPPRMWVTHPPSTEREENAKKRYVPAAIDERSAWELFRNPQAVKERMSAHVFRDATVEPTPMDKTLLQLDKTYGRAFLDRAYRGVFLNRSPVRSAPNVDSLYGPAVPPASISAVLAGLYPEQLATQVERLNERTEEKHALEALRDDVAQAPGGIIRHQGVELRKRDLPRAIAELDREITALRTQVETHDRTCRAAHLAAARELGQGWPEYLRGLASVLHFADHNAANLRDARGYVANIWGVVTADGRVTGKEINRLIEGCQQLYRVLQPLYNQAGAITLDRTLLRRLEVESWGAMLEELKLPPPTRENISDWINVIDGWIGAALHAVGRLRDAALEQLLLAEGQVAKFTRDKLKPMAAPPPSEVKAGYDTLLPGKERPLQKKLDWWDRFQVADGIVATVARSAVAVGIVGSVIALGGQVGSATMTIYNGLAAQVVVQVAEQEFRLGPHHQSEVDIPATGTLQVRTLSRGGQVIEEFEESLSGGNSNYIYNVASATPLMEWTAVYTPEGKPRPNNLKGPQERLLGTPRWTTTEVDFVFREPPARLQMDNNSSRSYRSVLSAGSTEPAWRQADQLKDPKDRSRLLLTHARWDETSSPQTLDWLMLAASEPEFAKILADRMRQSPNDVVLLRVEQDTTEGEAHAAVCERHRALAQKKPGEANLQYITIRCLEDAGERNAAFLAAQKKWPEHSWLSMAAGATLAEKGDYGQALPLYERAMKSLAPMRERIALDTARLRRLTHEGEGQPEIRNLVRYSSQLKMLTGIEAARGLEGGALAPYAAMANGRVDEAAELARAMPEGGSRALRLAAISDDAQDAVIEAAFAAPLSDEDDFESTIAMYALALRERRDAAPYGVQLGKQLGEFAPAVISYLDAAHRDPDNSAIYRNLPDVDFRLRLHLLYGACLLKGERAPDAWRQEVARGLFVGERGYLR
jgi:Zn-dependent protease with chaperone function/tetratricopeptide (TPR) repeat protein